MIFVKGYSLANIWKPWILNGFVFEKYFSYEHFFPVFFVTVACGIMSGFHSTQITIVSRTIANEHDGQFIFYNMMIAEGFIAMVWAAGTMAMISLGAENHGIAVKLTENGAKYFALVRDVIQQILPISVVGVVCRNALGSIGGFVATIGIIILPVTSGDAAIRSLRLILAEAMQIKNSDTKKKVILAAVVFLLIFCVLVLAKNNPNGFNLIWRYFGWLNQILVVFALSYVVIWLMQNRKKRFFWIPLIPLLFYSFVTCSYICSAKIGLNLPYGIAYILGIVFVLLVAVAVILQGYRKT